ncbi:MAG: hypothetical protein H6686_04455 [Fibrobacteria bacterium]|nr:hypothetical protein [Fibrobacteria bacterium]
MKSSPRIAMLALGLLSLQGCDSDQATGTMDENNHSAKMATIYLPDLRPASGAVVQAWSRDDSGKTPSMQTLTDEEGKFDIPELPEGIYRLVARKGDLVAMQDSLYTSNGRINPKSDTLGEAAKVTGRVRMTGGDNPASVTILVMGTDQLVNVDRQGRFLIDGLASGSFRLRLSTSLSGYTTTATTIQAKAGTMVDVGDVELLFAGIPPVDSLRASVDSTTRKVTLTWALPAIENFRYVRLQREPVDGSARPVSLGISTSGRFVDSSWFSTEAQEWLYTLRIHTLDGDSGKPAWAKISMGQLVLDSLFLGWPRIPSPIRVGQAFHFEVSVASGPSRPRALHWSFHDGLGTVERSIPMDSLPANRFQGFSFLDTSLVIHLPAPRQSGAGWLEVRLEGADGRSVRDSLAFSILPADSSGFDSTWSDSTFHPDSSRSDTTLYQDSTRADSAFHPDSSRSDTTLQQDSARSDSTFHPDSSRSDTTLQQDSARSDSAFYPDSSRSDTTLQQDSARSDSAFYPDSSRADTSRTVQDDSTHARISLETSPLAETRRDPGPSANLDQPGVTGEVAIGWTSRRNPWRGLALERRPLPQPRRNPDPPTA